MLSIVDSSVKLCDGVSRREILRAAGAGFLGLPAIAGRWSVADQQQASPKNACIVLFLMGGPAQHSTWDPKPAAPAEVRGQFGPIATTVPGIEISELMPGTATLMDRIAILRAVVTDDNAHSSSGYAMMTGTPHLPRNAENANPGPPNNWPTMASVVDHLYTGHRLLPASVRLPHQIFNTDQSIWPGQDSGWLGYASDPWLFKCEPGSANFDVPQFRLQADVSLGRLDQRHTLLEQIESKLQFAEKRGAVDSYSDRRMQAFDLLSSPTARGACDLQRESDQVRDQYGRGQFGQSVLLSRRLVETGVKFVQVNWFRSADEPMSNPCWDSHVDETNRLKNVLVPPFDRAYSALLSDLKQRGLLDSTLVVVMSEFGRSPKLDVNAGRGHWGHVFSVALAGGGIRGGTVCGASDKHAAYPEVDRVEPQDITATIFHCLGYRPESELRDPLGRPHPISRGRVIDSVI